MGADLTQEDLDDVAELVKSLGSDDYPKLLDDFLGARVPYDGFTLMLFNPKYSPTVIHADLNAKDHDAFWQHYMQGVYLLDPFYRLCSSGEEGLFHMRDIAPHGFFSSSYHKKYYGAAGIVDEMDFIYQAADNTSGMVALTRTEAYGRFKREDRKKLATLTKLVLSLMTRHLDLKGALFENALPNFRPALLQERLDRFGEAELTSREYEIVHLMLRGFSSKAAANYLDISPATERTHRKSIYKKMEVNSHAELLARAFAFLLEE